MEGIFSTCSIDFGYFISGDRLARSSRLCIGETIPTLLAMLCVCDIMLVLMPRFFGFVLHAERNEVVYLRAWSFFATDMLMWSLKF